MRTGAAEKDSSWVVVSVGSGLGGERFADGLHDSYVSMRTKKFLLPSSESEPVSSDVALPSPAPEP